VAAVPSANVNTGWTPEVCVEVRRRDVVAAEKLRALFFPEEMTKTQGARGAKRNSNTTTSSKRGRKKQQPQQQQQQQEAQSPSESVLHGPSTETSISSLHPPLLSGLPLPSPSPTATQLNSASSSSSFSSDLVRVSLAFFRRLARPAHSYEENKVHSSSPWVERCLDHLIYDGSCEGGSGGGDEDGGDGGGEGDAHNSGDRTGEIERAASSDLPVGMSLTDIARLLGWNGLYV
jgi:hypothetical protein